MLKPYFLSIYNWCRSHPFKFLGIAVLLYFGWQIVTSVMGVTNLSGEISNVVGFGDSYSGSTSSSLGAPLNPMAKTSYYQPSEDTVSTDRKYQTDSRLSLLVKNVRETLDKIENELNGVGGFYINKQVNTPEGLESGYVTMRVPNDQLKDFLSFLRENSLKVVNENIVSSDITKEYLDTEERLRTYESTKLIYQSMLSKAVTFDEIARAQQMIIQVQDQIDAMRGQRMYLEGLSKSTLISVNLSTDEYELPFTPDTPWRPDVIFKQAVRSLIANLRSIAGGAIWIGVYTPMWLGGILLFILIKKILWDRKA